MPAQNALGRALRAWLLAASSLLACLPASADELTSLSDEFVSASSLDAWLVETVVDGWPEQAALLQIDEAAGALTLEPETSGWFEDYRGVLRYKLVSGDFRVETRLRATGLAAAVPSRAFSLAGIMARVPRHESEPADWQPGQENWLFITAGTADAPGAPQFETKNTVDSTSALITHPGQQGWLELRIQRRGPRFDLSRRLPGEDWNTLRTLVRDDFPETIQVGLLAYTDWPTVSTFADAESFNEALVPSPPGQRDLRAEFDYVRFSDPRCWEADLDSDGVVALGDLARLLGGFGTASGAEPSEGDVDGDGDVDLGDLALLLAQFGESCGG